MVQMISVVLLIQLSAAFSNIRMEENSFYSDPSYEYKDVPEVRGKPTGL